MPIEVLHHGTTGPEVVVLHGGPGAPGSVRGLARLLADRFRVLEPLQRRSGSVPLSVARHVADLAAVAPRRAPIVGWSWGAMLALSYAAAHPDRATGLVLVGCGTYDTASRALYEQRMRTRLGAEGRAEMERLRQRVTATQDVHERERWLGRLGALAERAQAVDPLVDEEANDVVVDAAGHRETWDDALLLQREGREPAAFSAIAVPVLMLHGAEDPHPGEAIHAGLREVIPQIELVLLPRCGHEPWRERHAREPFLRLLGERLAVLAAS